MKKRIRSWFCANNRLINLECQDTIALKGEEIQVFGVILRAVLFFLLFFSFWMVWSGFFDLFHLSLGLISVLIVLVWNSKFLLKDRVGLKQRLAQLVQIEMYNFWLVYQIILANIDVMKLALHPRLYENLNPDTIELDLGTEDQIGIFLIANSITLTPGTVTVRLNDQKLLIHALMGDGGLGGVQDINDRLSAIFKKGRS